MSSALGGTRPVACDISKTRALRRSIPSATRYTRYTVAPLFSGNSFIRMQGGDDHETLTDRRNSGPAATDQEVTQRISKELFWGNRSTAVK